jgi:hypothetical protein
MGEQVGSKEKRQRDRAGVTGGEAPEDSRQQAADSRQHTAESRKETADSRQSWSPWPVLCAPEASKARLNAWRVGVGVRRWIPRVLTQILASRFVEYEGSCMPTIDFIHPIVVIERTPQLRNHTVETYVRVM